MAGGVGASLAAPGAPVLAVAGDGGILYGLQELATARQQGLKAVLLVVDDGGYGILREYQRSSFGETTAVDLSRPDFAASARAFGVHAESCSPEGLADALAGAFAQGPAVVHLPVPGDVGPDGSDRLGPPRAPFADRRGAL